MVGQINALEPQIQALSDDELRAKTDEFRERLKNGAKLDSLLPEAFAVVREASQRVLGLRHYDVQLIGGMVLHSGKIAEMRTGEGKTLVATLPVYLNALEGKGVHVVTVNDYLAKRDAAWMGKIYNFLGMSVGVVYPGMDHGDKRAAYAADITYGTNNEFGFDYLRDNMALSKEQRYQRGLQLRDRRRGRLDPDRRGAHAADHLGSGRRIAAALRQGQPHRAAPDAPGKGNRTGEPPAPGDYYVDEKQKQVHLSEEGMEHAEQLLREDGIIGEDEGLYDSQHIAVVHHLNAALRANAIYQRDVDYIVRDGEVIIVDEFTGRTLPGRRWSDGLHQAVEAKEGVPIQRENQTLASITFQNLFRMYKKLAGMTGTADTEAYEFQQIYGLEVVVIPTHRPMVRKDEPDVVFLKAEAEVRRDRRGHQGMRTSAASRCWSARRRSRCPSCCRDLLQQGARSARSAECQAARARSAHRRAGGPPEGDHDRDQHGRPRYRHRARRQPRSGAAPRCREGRQRRRARARSRPNGRSATRKSSTSGGLHIVGTERHESRRIDNQLRGRSGRQGDPGSSRFYLSLEDNLIRIFMGEGVARLMRMFGMKEDDAIEDRMVSRQIEKAQRKVEAHNFDIRKHLLEFDDIANDQRKVIYQQRNELLDSESVAETIVDVRRDVVTEMVRRFVPADSVDEQWDLAGLERELESRVRPASSISSSGSKASSEADSEDVLELRAGKRRAPVPREGSDGRLRSHARAREARDAVGARQRAGRNTSPAWITCARAFTCAAMRRSSPSRSSSARRSSCSSRCSSASSTKSSRCSRACASAAKTKCRRWKQQQQRQAQARQLQFQHAEAGGLPPASPKPPAEPRADRAQTPMHRDAPKVGRNDPCPCGSGKKYKHCHGQLA